jgi:branched-chain amino acid transport system ATP-binding protein
MPAILAFEKISKRFGAVIVANGLDFALAEGEALGIIGPNGAGKTTLFGIATGTVAPDAGRVTFASTDITHLAPERRCRMGIGRSFQIPQPFNGMTVFENLVVAAAFGGGHREYDVYPRCVALLEQCGLAAKANRLAGTLTLLDRKRLELARALATEPRVLLLDEVAGGLTEHECAALVDLIRNISPQRHIDHLDRAHRPRARRGGRPSARAPRRRLHRRGRPAGGDRLARGARNLHGNPRRCLSRSSR